MSDRPDWWVARYCEDCEKRKERCECGLTFAEKIKTLGFSVERIRRQREGEGQPGGRKRLG